MIKVPEIIREGLAKAGIRLSRISNTLPYRRPQFFHEMGVSVVLDIGANSGQYAKELRKHGYNGRIVSFEPLAKPFSILSAFAEGRDNHECMQVALGVTDGIAEINVSENLVSSSLLTVGEESLAACRESRRVSLETVELRRLDTVMRGKLGSGDRVHLKIDTQGTERDVLLGCPVTLPQVVSIELELSFSRVYDNQPLFTELCQLLEEWSFKCVWIEPVFMNKHTGHTLQVDGFFVRSNSQDGGVFGITAARGGQETGKNGLEQIP